MGEILNSKNNLIKIENENEEEIKKIISIDNDIKRKRIIEELIVKLNLQLLKEKLQNLHQIYKNMHTDQMLKLQKEHEEKLNEFFNDYKYKNKENEKNFYKDRRILQNKKNKINKFTLKISKRFNPKIKKMLIYKKKQRKKTKGI